MQMRFVTRSMILAFGLLPGGTVAGSALGQQTYNFSEVTRIAAGMLAGTNVPQPVPAFEVLLLRDGEVVYRRTFGQTTLGAVYATDSATKTLSGAVLASALETSATALTLDSTAGQFFAGLPADRAGATVRQMFSHTAGFAEASVAMASTTTTLQDAARTILSRPLGHAPGAAFSYGGSEMHVAGAIVELATQQPWNTVFAQRIAQPLGMTSTRYVIASPANPRIAGGAESNAPEFARFMEMLRRGGVHENVRVIGRAQVDAMFARQTPVGVPIQSSPINSADYGLGVWLDQRNAEGELVGALAAGARGFSAWIDFDDRIVGVFATDTSSTSNVIGALYAMRAAAQEAVRAGPACDALDFNLDGFFPDDNDLIDFLSVLSGGACSTGECNDIDFNNDGLFPDDADLVAFLTVLAGGEC
jgi:CubicO group peptidase (beta-lactamase class C family)